jgi:hypothetical protein
MSLPCPWISGDASSREIVDPVSDQPPLSTAPQNHRVLHFDFSETSKFFGWNSLSHFVDGWPPAVWRAASFTLPRFVAESGHEDKFLGQQSQ